MISTPQGQYGYLPDGSFVNTLPGAAPIPLFGKDGEDVVFSPVLIPANGITPTITINAQQDRYFFLSSANGTALGLRGSGVTPGDRDTVRLDYAGTALSGYALTPQRSTTALLPQIGMELSPQQRLLFRFWQLDVPGGSTARFDALPGEHGVTYANGSPGESEHFVIVDAVDGAAEVSRHAHLRSDERSGRRRPAHHRRRLACGAFAQGRDRRGRRRHLRADRVLRRPLLRLG